jgi:cytochrome c peroxidase
MRLCFLSRLPAALSVSMVSLACNNAAPVSTQTDSAMLAAAGSSIAGATSASANAAAGSVAAPTVTAAAGASAAAGSGAAAAAGPSPIDVQRVLTDARQIFSALPASYDSPMHAVTEEKITLGRQLYYEKRLSKNHDLSCNSCHDLASYGVDARAPVGATSRGHKEQIGGRNSPTTYNAAGHVAQFWDGRAADVEAQAQGPVLNPVEMALPSAAQAVTVLKSIPGYAPLFAAAFPGEADPVTFENAANAIGAFERKLVTPGRFDAFLTGQLDALTMPEIEGLLLFQASVCAACHGGAELGGAHYRKLGAMKEYPVIDTGRFQVTMQEPDRHFFKVPSLRNIDKTGPYFHDGSVATLEQAVKLMGEYQTPKGVMTDAEVTSIVTFLKALTGELPIAYIQEPAQLPSGPATPAPDPS